jgi:hypothetical protein
MRLARALRRFLNFSRRVLLAIGLRSIIIFRSSQRGGVRGGGKDGQKGEENSKLLEAHNTDLDEARSWFAVAWYPILCHSQVCS